MFGYDLLHQGRVSRSALTELLDTNGQKLFRKCCGMQKGGQIHLLSVRSSLRSAQTTVRATSLCPCCKTSKRLGQSVVVKKHTHFLGLEKLHVLLAWKADHALQEYDTLGPVKFQAFVSEFWGKQIQQTWARVPKNDLKHANI
jgi:hypothetical protein